MIPNPSDNSKGFTLIELMIVIAIPNYISYRGKAHCSVAESDVDTVIEAIADYFAIPGNFSVSENSPGMPVSGTGLSNGNTYTIGGVDAITVTVTDESGLCPLFDTTPKQFNCRPVKVFSLAVDIINNRTGRLASAVRKRDRHHPKSRPDNFCQIKDNICNTSKPVRPTS